MKCKRLIIIALCAAMLTGCAAKPNAENGASPAPTASTKPSPEDSGAKENLSVDDIKALALEFTQKLTANDYDFCIERLSAAAKASLTKEALAAGYAQMTAASGAFVSIADVTVKQGEGAFEVEAVAKYEKQALLIKMSYNASAEVEGLWLTYKDDETLPEALEEKELTIGSEFPLPAKLTTQKGKKSDAAIILVHGSGPNDMDETIMANKPFRDIAWGLASKGVDVLRYDKRTFSHASKIQAMDMSRFTINDETIDDAVLGAKALEGEGYKNVYLLGHSLGAMVALRTDKAYDGRFAGLVLLAGTPRTLTDVMIDQNNAIIAAMTDEKDIEASKKIVQAEVDKLATLDTLSQAELDKATVFGMPANYIKDLNGVDTAKLAQAYTRPILVLQGGADFQVSPENDYPLWQAALAHNKQADFKLYDGLNHLFMVSTGEKKGTVEEYANPAKVEQAVIDDIAAFILK